MNNRVFVTGSCKSNDKRRPRIRISGLWLNELGFEYNSIVNVEYGLGQITLKLSGKGTENYINIARSILKNKSGGILYVKDNIANKVHVPYIQIMGFWMEDLGFSIGSVILLQASYGLLTVKLIDLQKLQLEG